MVEFRKLLLVTLTVILTLASAALLNFGAKHLSEGIVISSAVIFSVLTFNVLKLKLWGDIYQRYHLHDSYPLTAVFFPLIYLYAVAIGEGTLVWNKTLGVLLIVIGVGVMSYKRTSVQ